MRKSLVGVSHLQGNNWRSNTTASRLIGIFPNRLEATKHKIQDIRDISLEELTETLVSWGEKPFRAKQVNEWLWKKNARSFDSMTNISTGLREKLKQEFSFNTVKADLIQKSSDGTIKIGFRLSDGNFIEGVLIPTSKRMTACVSSQVGCSLNCTFCATGYLKRARNLKHYEVFDQVAIINEMAIENYDIPLSNIVFMGMGEPLLNYNEVLHGIDNITSPDAMGMSPSRITLSTAGITKMIRKLADDGVRFNLALSLHAATNEKRSAIMPINDSNSLEDLTEALNYFYDKTGSRITLEYCVINEVNDHPEDAEELAAFARNIVCKINLIEYNSIENADYKSSSGNRIDRFAKQLESKRLIVNVRRSRGKDIDAACGQLANKN
ncbi:MAG: 23S rRNA (adenine(2503)-C(2))-methyltransferase RlmN [Bacteroidia bacterium]|nr:23S rRNA (adenine(2503)-C(2))-methyltransferase RlmN [Bacteroidia bacterium]